MSTKVPFVVQTLMQMLSGGDTGGVVLYNRALDRIEILGTDDTVWNRHEVGVGQTNILTMSDLNLEDVKTMDSYEILGEL